MDRLAILVCLFLAVHMVVCVSIPDGYVLDVNATCSSTINGRTVIKVLTDLDIYAEGQCKNNHIAVFKSKNKVAWRLFTYYKLNNSNACVFELMEGTNNTHVMRLSIWWAEPEGMMLNHEEFRVICELDGNGGVNSSVIAAKPKKPIDITKGKKISHSTLQVVNQNGQYIQRLVPLGRKIRLLAKLNVTVGNSGIRALDCFVTSGKKKFQILSNGCGNGFIFPKNSSFITNGFVSTSPPFPAFTYEGSDSIVFKCSFAECNGVCDTRSCVASSREKRDVQGSGLKTVELATELLVRKKRHANTLVIKPCVGMLMNGCFYHETHENTDVYVAISTFMTVLMFLFPAILVVGLLMFMCCPNKNSYGITDPSS